MMLLFGFLALLPSATSSLWYDGAEVRESSYDIDLFEVPFGLDPSNDLSELPDESLQSLLNKEETADLGELSHTVLIRSRSGQKFACQLPVVDHSRKEFTESYNPKYLAEIVQASFYVNGCVEKSMGWWRYEVCRGKTVRQTHGAKNEAIKVEHSLGLFSGKFNLPQYTESTEDRLMYLEEAYDGGSLCDLPGRRVPRRSVVRYECDPALASSEAYLYSINEEASCEYTFIVKVGSLCKLDAFVPRNSRETNWISCQPFLNLDDRKKFAAQALEHKKLVEESRIRSREAHALMESIERRRKAIKRCELTWKNTMNLAVRQQISAEFERAFIDYLTTVYFVKNGRKPDAHTTRAMQKLIAFSDAMDTDVGEGNEYDWDRANIWYYFNDKSWDKKQFPLALDYVDAMNEYYDRVVQSNVYFVLEDFLDPHNPEYNLLITPKMIMTKLMVSVPSWITTKLSFFDDEFLEAINSGELFGSKSSEIVRLFVSYWKQNAQEFIKMSNLETLDEILTLFSPVYGVIELLTIERERYLSTDLDLIEEYIRADFVELVETLMIAAETAKIQYVAAHPHLQKNHAELILKFKDIDPVIVQDTDKMIGILSLDASRFDLSTSGPLVKRCSVAVSKVRRAAFDSLWSQMSEKLRSTRRLRLYASTSGMDALREAINGMAGTMLLSEFDGSAAGDLIDVLASAGLGDAELSIKVIEKPMGSDGTRLPQEEIDLLVQEQLDEIAEMKRLKKRQRNYNTRIVNY